MGGAGQVRHWRPLRNGHNRGNGNKYPAKRVFQFSTSDEFNMSAGRRVPSQ